MSVSGAREGVASGFDEGAIAVSVFPGTADAVGYLDRLIPRLAVCGVVGSVRRSSDGPPVLVVRRDAGDGGPGGPGLSGEVIADDSCAGLHVSGDVHPVATWSYWWAWGERIAPASDPGRAARVIAAGLSADGGCADGAR